MSAALTTRLAELQAERAEVEKLKQKHQTRARELRELGAEFESYAERATFFRASAVETALANGREAEAGRIAQQIKSLQAGATVSAEQFEAVDDTADLEA